MLACASSPPPPGQSAGQPAGESSSASHEADLGELRARRLGRRWRAWARPRGHPLWERVLARPAARARDLGRRVRVPRLGRAAAPARRGGEGRDSSRRVDGGSSGHACGEARGARLRGPSAPALSGRLRQMQRLRRLLPVGGPARRGARACGAGPRPLARIGGIGMR